MTAVEFYKVLPEPYKSELVEIVDKLKSSSSKYHKAFYMDQFRKGKEALNVFSWSNTKQGDEYWREVANNYDSLVLNEEKKSYTAWEGDY